MPNRPGQVADLRVAEHIGPCERGHARVPERLGRVDVAEPGQNRLIEQCSLDRAAPGAERTPQRRTVERRVTSVDAQWWESLGTAGEQGQSREGPAVDEVERGPVGELQYRASEPWHIVGLAGMPIAGHAEVHDQHEIAAEEQKLILSTPLHSFHPMARDAAGVAG